MDTKTYLAIFPVSLLFQIAGGFYVSGLAPVTYCNKTTEDCQNEVPVFVNRLNSLHQLIPFEYGRFDFCENDEASDDPVMNLGQVVFGERIKPSAYKFKFMEYRHCEKVCEKTYVPGDKTSLRKLNFMRKIVDLDYQHHWIVDNMPVVWCYEIEGGEKYCSRSLPVGCYVTRNNQRKGVCIMSASFYEADTHYFFNHIELTITYNPANDDVTTGRILSVLATPKSIAYDKTARGDQMCQNSLAMGIKNGRLMRNTTIRYTYSVTWRAESNIKWASRWDFILDGFSYSNIKLFNAINSFVIVLFLGGLLLRLLWNILSKKKKEEKKKPCCICCWGRNKNKSDNWKLLYGDIFRPPNCGMLLAVLNGSGVQLIFTSVIILVLAAIGILLPPNRGALETSSLILYVCLGFPAGYVSARLYKSFGGEKRFINALLTATVCPGIVFVLILIANFVYMTQGSSAAIPVTTIFALLGLWLGTSLPLTLLGSFFGFRKKVYQHPVKTAEVARPVPKRRLRLKQVFTMLIAGILPFGSIFIQLFFILNSIFSYQLYYNFGYLALVFIMMALSCSMVTVLLSYFHLSAEDYHWWWRSFLSSGFTAVYVFMYCIHYFVAKTEFRDIISVFNYGIYIFVMSFLLFLVTGSIGFFSSFWFMRKIYSTIKGYDMWSTEGSKDQTL